MDGLEQVGNKMNGQPWSF